MNPPGRADDEARCGLNENRTGLDEDRKDAA